MMDHNFRYHISPEPFRLNIKLNQTTATSISRPALQLQFLSQPRTVIYSAFSHHKVLSFQLGFFPQVFFNSRYLMMIVNTDLQAGICFSQKRKVLSEIFLTSDPVHVCLSVCHKFCHKFF